MFFVIGLMLFCDAHYAEMHHTIMSKWPRSSWMDPWQGYVGAFLCLLATAYALVLAFRHPTNHDNI
jgi:hypothetical protein